MIPIDTMSKNTSMSLGSHFESFIAERVSDGRFGTASEVVRAGLRLLEEEEMKIAALRNSLELGERSGFVKDYDIAKVLRSVTERRKSQ